MGAPVDAAFPSPAGVAIDDKLRVLDEADSPIPNLYVCGEIFGCTRPMGRGYESGTGVGPTVTTGRLLGQKLLSW